MYKWVYKYFINYRIKYVILRDLNTLFEKSENFQFNSENIVFNVNMQRN